MPPITTPFSTELLTAIRANAYLDRELDLSYEELTLENVVALAAALNSNRYIKSCRLFTCNIDNAGAQALAANTTLTTLNVSFNRIGDAGAQALAANSTLTTLNVSFNRIGDAGAQALAANTALTTLGVRNNGVGDAGARALAANTTLTTLNMELNRIGDAGAQALAANTTLTTLGVSNNRIGDAGAQTLAANTTLTTLDVNFNKIGEDLREALALLPDQNKKRLANVANLATVVASFRANPESEINASFLPLLPLIHTWAGLKTPTVQMEKVISATFFKNLVRDSAKAVKDKEKKEEKLATAAVSHSKGDTKGNANKRKREDSNESTEEVKPSFKEARIAESLAASVPRFNAGDLSAHSSRASSNSSSSASSSTSPPSAASASTEVKSPAVFRAG